MEATSPDDPRRDTETKRREYAQAGIPEYWIIDPASRTVLVLQRDPGSGDYREHGRFGPGETATSATLGGLRRRGRGPVRRNGLKHPRRNRLHARALSSRRPFEAVGLDLAERLG